MKNEFAESAPVGLERATELQEIINRAAREKKAVVVDPDEGGITGSSSVDLISSNENANALERYQRHY